MPIKFIALAHPIFLWVYDRVQGQWTAKFSSILTYNTSCRQKQANCQITLEVYSFLTTIDSLEPQCQADLTSPRSLFQANRRKAWPSLTCYPLLNCGNIDRYQVINKKKTEMERTWCILSNLDPIKNDWLECSRVWITKWFTRHCSHQKYSLDSWIMRSANIVHIDIIVFEC